MSQQINLFNPIFLKQKKHFSALTMAQGLGLILLGSIAVTAYAKFQLSGLAAQAAATTGQLKSTQAQLAKVSADYAPRQPSKKLDEEVAKAEAELNAQQQVLATLQAGGLGNTKGYSDYMRAFSRQIVDGLWLTGFSIAGAGSDIHLRGRALKPELVPAYITRLKQEPAMQGKSFSMLAMQVPEADAENKSGTAGGKERAAAPYIEFSLRSAAPGKDASEAQESGARVK